MDTALLLLRLVVGLLLALHGLQKLAGWFGGYGLDGTGGYMESLGFRPGRFWAGIAGSSELVGGLLVAAGFLTPLGSAALIGTMLVAARTDHKGKGPWVFNGGWEYPLVVAAVAAALAFAGPGELSLDHALDLDLAGGAWGGAALAGAVFIGFATLATRRTSAAAAVEAQAA